AHLPKTYLLSTYQYDSSTSSSTSPSTVKGVTDPPDQSVILFNPPLMCLEQDLNQDRLISWSQHNQTDKEGRRLIIQACAIASGAVVFSESSLSTWEDKDSSLGDIKPMKWARRVRADCGNTDRIFEFITIFESGCVANHGVRLSSSVQRRQQW
ncbi:unnamed protein product, partial [Brassica rapa subsp. narinosa]